MARLLNGLRGRVYVTGVLYVEQPNLSNCRRFRWGWRFTGNGAVGLWTQYVAVVPDVDMITRDEKPIAGWKSEKLDCFRAMSDQLARCNV